jgi:hypothetical protein
LTSVTIPNGVVSIASYAFGSCAGLTSVAIPASVSDLQAGAFGYCASLTGFSVDPLNPGFTSSGGVVFNKNQTVLIACPAGLTGPYAIPTGITNIGVAAFAGCSRLTGLALGHDVVTIENSAFESCSGLTNMTIPSPVRIINAGAFSLCTGLRTVTIAGSLTNIGDYAFQSCFNLEGLYFRGNAPSLAGDSVFLNDTNLTIYYLPATTGWGPFFGWWPAALWNPVAQTTDSNFGIKSNRFGFNVTGTTDIPIVVEASTNAMGASWTPLLNGTLTNGSIYFSDPQWTNYPKRFYRIRSP